MHIKTTTEYLLEGGVAHQLLSTLVHDLHKNQLELRMQDNKFSQMLAGLICAHEDSQDYPRAGITATATLAGEHLQNLTFAISKKRTGRNKPDMFIHTVMGPTEEDMESSASDPVGNYRVIINLDDEDESEITVTPITCDTFNYVSGIVVRTAPELPQP